VVNTAAQIATQAPAHVSAAPARYPSMPDAGNILIAGKQHAGGEHGKGRDEIDRIIGATAAMSETAQLTL
jgi:hypothetical protein